MKILIAGSDVSDSVTMSSCIHDDSVLGKSDTLSIFFNDETDESTDWRKWGLEKGTEIAVSTESFDTGTMYVSGISMIDGALGVRAQSAQISSKDEYSKSYMDVSLMELLQEGADAMGLVLDTYSLINRKYSRISRIKKDWIGFIHERCVLEGAGVKIFDKKLIVFDEDAREKEESVKEFTQEDFSNRPSFCTKDNLIKSVRNLYQADQLIDTFTESDIELGRRIEIEQECSSIGESIRFSKNIMRSVNKREYLMDGIIPGCELSSGVNVTLTGSFFGFCEGTAYIERTVTDLLHDKQHIYTRKVG